MESKFDVIDIDEVESLLLAHETRLDKFKKKVLEDVASINLTSSSASQASSASESSQPQASVNVTAGSDYSTFNPNFTPNFGSNRGRGGRSGRVVVEEADFLMSSAKSVLGLDIQLLHAGTGLTNSFSHKFHLISKVFRDSIMLLLIFIILHLLV